MNINKLLQNKKVLLLLLIAVLLATSGGTMLSIGIITGYQGLQAEFYGVYFKDHLYTQGNINNPNVAFTPSAFEVFDHLNFDPDGAGTGRPNLKMSMQPITVDTNWPPKTYGPWQIKVNEGVEEDGKIYDVYKQFQVDEYRCSWSVNMWCDGPEGEAYQDDNHWYYDTQIWVKLTPQNFVYYEDNPDQVYFAPAYIGLTEDAVWRSGDNNPNSGAVDYEMAGEMDIFPEAKGEVMGIFYQCRGTEINVHDKVLTYQEKKLDPNIFRDSYWIRFGAERFGAKAWMAYLVQHHWKYPSANLQFQINVFVVGEWTVKLEAGEIPELEPREPYVQYKDWLWRLGAMFEGFVNNPLTYVWLIAYVIIIFLAVRVVLKVYSKGAI